MLEQLLENANNDRERWEYIIQHKHEVESVLLDNDTTYVDLGNIGKDREHVWFRMRHAIGNSNGLYELFDALGINCVSV